MTKLQRIALLNLGLAGAGLLLQLLRLVVSDLPIRLLTSTITLILCCFLVVSYFHRREIVKQGAGQYDERDKSIHRTAALTGLVVTFGVFSSATLIAFLSVGPGGSVEIGWVLGIFILSAMSFFFAYSAAVLVRYGWGGNNAEE